jgi:hypothetical protein
MNDDTLKSQIFAEFSADLAKESATPENTEVIEVERVPSIPGSFMKILRKFGGKFVSLVGKYGAIGFVIYLSVCQAVPEHAKIFAPPDGTSFITIADSSHQIPTLESFPLSGYAQMVITEYGVNPSRMTINYEVPYQLSVGDKITFVPSEWNIPSSFTPMLTGHLLDYRS